MLQMRLTKDGSRCFASMLPVTFSPVLPSAASKYEEEWRSRTLLTRAGEIIGASDSRSSWIDATGAICNPSAPAHCTRSKKSTCGNTCSLKKPCSSISPTMCPKSRLPWPFPSKMAWLNNDLKNGCLQVLSTGTPGPNAAVTSAQSPRPMLTPEAQRRSTSMYPERKRSTGSRTYVKSVLLLLAVRSLPAKHVSSHSAAHEGS
mmetsp:Transcript_76368/g.210870  ORF Transcript_76368/g.210870 Transcript_76368/m.210870 type:complete len:203 (-) Transcript_76368:105-713(-)